jgi:uncharacterized membrane protein
MELSDERMDATISTLLRVGVGLAAGTVAVGFAAVLLEHGGSPAAYHVFRADSPRTLRGVAAGVLQWKPGSWIQLGVLLLIATPIARVVFSVFAFAAQRDWIYVAITLVVLSVLLFGLLNGMHA